MNKFARRYAGTELIDEPDVPFADWEVCLRELNSVNTYLGGHAITIEGVKALVPVERSGPLHILEIGCGGGDNLKAIHKWSAGKMQIHFTGVDINKACTEFASENCAELNANFICSDYKLAKFDDVKPDIIFNSLFCHHFSDGQLVEMLQWMKANSRLGFFINDLQRNPIAYYSIMGLTQAFSRSYLVKHDGPVSVLRGFHRNEWDHLLGQAGIMNFSIRWRWAFRYLVLCTNEQ